MGSIKSFFGFLFFLLMAAAFFVLIGLEIHYGIAGGKFGGVELTGLPGTFWCFIGLQALWGFSLLRDSIKGLWNFLNRNSKPGDQHQPPAKLIAVFWLLASLFLAIVSLLAIWSAFEMSFHMYKLLIVYEMPGRVILGGLFLLCILVFCYLIYQFLLSSLIETFFPKARTSFRLLRKKKIIITAAEHP